MPDMQYVDSSNIEAIGYDGNNRELHVRFLESGETYVYEDVDEAVFQDMLQTESKGSFLNRQIKPSHNFRKL